MIKFTKICISVEVRPAVTIADICLKDITDVSSFHKTFGHLDCAPMTKWLSKYPVLGIAINNFGPWVGQVGVTFDEFHFPVIISCLYHILVQGQEQFVSIITGFTSILYRV